jgi:cell division septum initiation protein DivIVA
MLGGMYKTFQGLDDLQNMVDQAYGVPMTSNCMVPRREVQDILDEVRTAIPVEMDDAQDVLDHRDGIIANAEDQAETLVSDAEAERDRILEDAQRQAEDMVADAEERAHSTVARAEAEADRLITDARNEYEQTTARAEAEAERLVNEGNESYDRSVNEGIAEQQRLVSESEVVRVAEDESRRIVESAHSDSDRLRRECDHYVDSTLAQFEESLTGTLRTVSRDRSALRKGAGVSGNRYTDEAREPGRDLSRGITGSAGREPLPGDYRE